MKIILAATQKLQVLLGGAVTTNQLPIVASYGEVTASDESLSALASQLTNTNSATPVDIVGAPASGKTRTVTFLSIFNADTVAATFTLRYNDNGTTYVITTETLAVGDTFILGEES